MEEVKARIEQRAHREPSKFESPALGKLKAYYDDKRAPYWTGQLISSIRVQHTAEGVRLNFAAPYTSELEDGNLDTMVVIEGELERWTKAHYIRRRSRYNDAGEIHIMNQHQFIWPVLEELMESGRGLDIMGDAIVDVMKAHNIGK